MHLPKTSGVAKSATFLRRRNPLMSSATPKDLTDYRREYNYNGVTAQILLDLTVNEHLV